MKRSRRSLASLFLAALLTLQLLALPATASGSSPESTDRADKLASLNLFQGTGDGYQLDNIPTRMQGLVMLIRLLGLEEEALAYICPVCFWENDVLDPGGDDPSDENRGMTLRQGRENYRKWGAVREDLARHARPPRPEEIPDQQT